MKKESNGFILFDMAEFEEWLADQIFSRRIIRIQNHHTWKPDYSNFKGDNHLALLANMKNYHVNHNGWSDIAQNLSTFPDGTVAVCRSFDKTPVGIKGANTEAICIEHIGNFDLDCDAMTSEHKSSIINLNALLCHKFCLPPNDTSIVYHHWFDLQTGIRQNGKGSTKTCPGTNFFGGNKVEDAKQHFIPLILERVNKLDSKLGNFSYGQVTASTLNVRNSPSSTGAVVGSLPNNAVVRITETDHGWYKIGKEAQWVYSKYVAKIDDLDELLKK